MKQLPAKPVKMSILSEATFLPIVRAAVEKMCELIGFDMETAGEVMLSVDEAITNVIRHAYHYETNRPIEIELTPMNDGARSGLRIAVRDYGRQVDESQIRSRDLAEIRPGGLGVHIMTECMDAIIYRHAPEGGTLLTMFKNLSHKDKCTS